MAASGRAGIEPHVSLYRVVDAAELAYSRTSGNYGSNPSRSGKYSALTLAGARAFASAPMNAGATITEISLPRSLLNHGYTIVDPGLHGAGRSVYFDEQALPMVYAAMTAPAIVRS